MEAVSKIVNDDTRVVVNLDFSVVVPAGVEYTSVSQETGSEYVLKFTDGSEREVVIKAPKEVVGKMNFTDPIAKGVIRNFTAGIIREAYGKEEKQTVVVQGARLIALTAAKADQNKTVTFVIGAEKGLYEGHAKVPGKNDRERVKWVKNFLETLTEYTASPGEEAAVTMKIKEAQQQKEREARLEQELQENKMNKEAEEMMKAASEEAVETAVVEEKTATGENESKTAEDAPAVKAGEIVDEAAEDALAEAPAVEVVSEEDAKASTEEKESTDETAEAPAAEADPEADAKEAQKKERAAVESQIDNYIARTERTAEKVSDEFHDYLGRVQEYALHTHFISETDPNYLAMLDGIQEAADALGEQLDTIVSSADENAANACDAGISEAYVERLIRMMDRLDRRYDDLCVTMNQKDYIAYMRPTKMDDIFKKWQENRFMLPSYIERAEKEIEQKALEDIKARIENARAKIIENQNALASSDEQIAAFQSSIEQKRAEVAAFNAGYESDRQALLKEREERLTAAIDQVHKMEDVLADEQDELMTLNQELAHTFSLNVNRKRELNLAISDTSEEIDQIKGDLQSLQEKKDTLRNTYDAQIADLDDKKQTLTEELELLEQQEKDIHASFARMQNEIETLRKVIEESEDEREHIHENYLLGKYNGVRTERRYD